MKKQQFYGKDNTYAKSDAQDMINQYSSMSQNRLVDEMFAAARQLRQSGALTDAQLDAFYSNASGMLDDVQRERLKILINELKSR